MNISREYTPCAFGQMHLYLAGTQNSHSRPLVCFHMSPYSGRFYRFFQQEMARDRLVICPDTPGYGGSDGPEVAPDIPALAGAMAEMLDELSLETVDLLGFHTGVYIATELAVLCPEKINRLVLPGIPLVPAENRPGLRAHYAAPRPYFEKPDFLDEKWREGLAANPQGWQGERYLEMFAEVLRAGGRSNWGFQAVFGYAPEERLPRISQPVLIPVADEVLADNSRAAAELFPNAQLQELPELRGDMFEKSPELLAGHIRGFLDQE